MGHFGNWYRSIWHIGMFYNKKKQHVSPLVHSPQHGSKAQLWTPCLYTAFLFCGLWQTTTGKWLYSRGQFWRWDFSAFTQKVKRGKTQFIYHLPLLFVRRCSSRSIISSSRAQLILPNRWRASLQRCAQRRKRGEKLSKATFCPEYDVTSLPLNLFSFKVLAMICSGFQLVRGSTEVDFEVDKKKKKKKNKE